MIVTPFFATFEAYFQTMIRYFSQPFPHQLHSFRQQLLLAAGVGAFVAFFLIVFQPFGTDDWIDTRKPLILSGYGLVTFLGMMLMSSFVPLWFKNWYAEDRWTVGKEIVWTIVVILTITIGNFFYSHWVFDWPFRFSQLVTWLLVTATVGLMPSVVLTLIKYGHLMKKYNTDHFQMTSPPSPQVSNTIVLIAENAKDSLRLGAEELLFVESADNYSEVVFVKEQKLQKMLLRGSLTYFETQVQACTHIRRCHRSFIVNLKQVEKVSGNAQGYKLQLKNWQGHIPVARKYGDLVKQYFDR